MTRATKLVLASLIVAAGYAGARMFPRAAPPPSGTTEAVGPVPAPADQPTRPASLAAAPAAPDAGRATARAAPGHLAPTYARDVASPPSGRADDRPTSAATAPAPVPRRTHRIVDGDTLAGLAQRYLGDSGRAEEIYMLNRNVLPSPSILPIGVVLQLPPRHRRPSPATTVATPPHPAPASPAAAPARVPDRPAEPHARNDGEATPADDLVPIPPGLFRRRTG